MTNIILCDVTASVSELKNDPVATASAGGGYTLRAISPNLRNNMGRKIAGLVFLFFAVWGMASVIELHYWRSTDTYSVWLKKHLRISPEYNEKSLIGIEMEIFDKACSDNGNSLPSPKNKTVYLCAVMIPPCFSWFRGVCKVN